MNRLAAPADAGSSPDPLPLRRVQGRGDNRSVLLPPRGEKVAEGRMRRGPSDVECTLRPGIHTTRTPPHPDPLPRVQRRGDRRWRFPVRGSLLLPGLVWLLLLLPGAARLVPVVAEEIPIALRGLQPSPRNPVFSGRPGHWDAKIRERGWILRDGDLWKLWYTGYDPDVTPPMVRLGYATSPDGIVWHRCDDRPLIDDLWVEDMMIVRQAGRWLMFAEGRNDQAQLLESPDGMDWTRRGALDIRLTTGELIPAGPYGTPTALFDNGVWNLFYERRDAGIWLARSTDLNMWHNVMDEPVLVPGPDTYDALMIAMNQVVVHEGRYLAVLHGTGTPTKPRQWCTFLATSDDLIHWRKSSENPLFPIAENRSSGILVPDGAGWRLYTMHDRVDLFLPVKAR